MDEGFRIDVLENGIERFLRSKLLDPEYWLQGIPNRFEICVCAFFIRMKCRCPVAGFEVKPADIFHTTFDALILTIISGQQILTERPEKSIVFSSSI